MNSDKNLELQTVTYNRKNIGWSAIGWTVVYCILFPFLFRMALFSTMVFDNDNMSIPLGLFVIAIALLVPLSIPVSIYFMWSHYVQRCYKKCRFFCWMPVMVFCAACILDFTILALFEVYRVYM